MHVDADSQKAGGNDHCEEVGVVRRGRDEAGEGVAFDDGGESGADKDLDEMEALLDRQREACDADDALLFHSLDDQFHREICERSGLGFAWDIIRENKSHMDRVRLLSLPVDSGSAMADHILVLEALRKRDPDMAAQMMRDHLTLILSQIPRIRAEYGQYFEDEKRNG